MGTTAAKLQGILTSKEAIRQAVIEKGQDVPTSTPLSGYADKIAAIQSGGGVTNGHLVTWLDSDGSFIKSQLVEHGADATHPANPVGDTYKTFAMWVGENLSVTEDRYIMAVYNTVDGKSYVFLELNELLGNTFSCIVYKKDSSPMVVDWGDGVVDTDNSSSGYKTLTHTYASKMSIVISFSGNIRFGGAQNYAFQYQKSYLKLIKKILIGHDIGEYAFFAMDGLNDIVIGAVVGLNAHSALGYTGLIYVAIPPQPSVAMQSVFSQCSNLKIAVIGNGITGLLGTFSYCSNLGYVNIPSGVTTISQTSFRECRSLRSLILPSTVKTIDGAFNRATALESINLDGVTNVTDNSGVGAFYECRQLKKITFRSSSSFNIFSGSAGYNTSAEECRIGAGCASVNWMFLLSSGHYRAIIFEDTTPPSLTNASLSRVTYPIFATSMFPMPPWICTSQRLTGRLWLVGLEVFHKNSSRWIK